MAKPTKLRPSQGGKMWSTRVAGLTPITSPSVDLDTDMLPTKPPHWRVTPQDQDDRPPAALKTTEDYAAAPLGTRVCVERNDQSPLVLEKVKPSTWVFDEGNLILFTDECLGGDPRFVLSWGKQGSA